jgi:hypothetical protein
MNTQKKPQQMSMFSAGEGTALFSGSPVRAKVSAYRPETQHRQKGMFNCSVCRDTGEVVLKGKKQKCICSREDKK